MGLGLSLSGWVARGHWVELVFVGVDFSGVEFGHFEEGGVRSFVIEMWAV